MRQKQLSYYLHCVVYPERQKRIEIIVEENYQIIHMDKPDDTAWRVIGGGVHDYNIAQAGDDQSKMLCFVLRSPNQELVGGLIGQTHWNWLHIELLFVKEDLRGRGHGHRLLMAAEQEARKRGAKRAYLDTLSFQAPGFYKKHGYEVFGELQDFPVGHQRYYLAKQL
jgi:ribosomal protein S18 acetylase RimI-like enzyme